MAQSYNALKPGTGSGDLRPTNGFVSGIFGGPVPLRSPTGAVVGPYDHQVVSAAFDLTGKAAAVAPFFDPALWAGIPEIMVAIGAARAGAVRSALAAVQRGTIDGHHVIPKFMGGAVKDPTLPLDTGVHIANHQVLNAGLKKPPMALQLGRPNFPPVGGSGGSTADWGNFLFEHPGRYDDALTVLRATAAKIDRKYGTSIGVELSKRLKPSQGRGRNMAPLAIPLEQAWRDERKR